MCTYCTIIIYMTMTVSIGELRNNLSLYLDRVAKGTKVLIRDEKREITIAQIIQTSVFDKTMYDQVLKKTAGVITAENHPEWETLSDVTTWLTRNRSANDRHF